MHTKVSTKRAIAYFSSQTLIIESPLFKLQAYDNASQLEGGGGIPILHFGTIKRS